MIHVMSDQDHPSDDLFRREMGGVKPLGASPRVRLQKNAESGLALEARRRAAVSEQQRDRFGLSTELREALDPYMPVEFKRPGVQNGVFRKLKQGRYQQDARLDLHRMDVEQARREVYEFIRQARQYDLRNLIIIHGRGNHSQSREAVLKSYINQWLPELEPVQAFCSAQPRHGGVGAVYVLLKKSEQSRQDNRDRFSRGRSESPY